MLEIINITPDCIAPYSEPRFVTIAEIFREIHEEALVIASDAHHRGDRAMRSKVLRIASRSFCVMKEITMNVHKWELEFEREIEAQYEAFRAYETLPEISMEVVCDIV